MNETFKSHSDHYFVFILLSLCIYSIFIWLCKYERNTYDRYEDRISDLDLNKVRPKILLANILMIKMINPKHKSAFTN